MFVTPSLTVRVTAPEGWQPVQDSGMQVTDQTAEISAVLDRIVRVGIDFEQVS